jgi:hypothetical protein
MSCIGSTRVHAVALIQNSGFDPFRRVLPSEEFQAVAHETGCLPKRRRRLIPEVVAWLVMYARLHGESMTQALLQAWPMVGPPGELVSEEAFCQARNALTLRFWKRLFQRLCVRYEHRHDACMRWKGYRVLAGDGTEATLPILPSLIRCFGRPKNAKGYAKAPQARLVALCSVFTGFCVAFTFVALRVTEHAALGHLLRHLKPKDLLLLDRGFFSLCGRLADPQTPRRLPHASVQPDRRIAPRPSIPWPR